LALHPAIARLRTASDAIVPSRLAYGPGTDTRDSLSALIVCSRLTVS
jgi:hypothetical protein